MIYEFSFRGLLTNDAFNGIDSQFVTIHADRNIVLIESDQPSQVILDTLNALNPSRFVLISSQSSIKGETSVCLFECFVGMKQQYAQFDNRGVCRLTTSHSATSIDLSVSGLVPLSTYNLDVNEYGNLEKGCMSTGGLFRHLCEFVADCEGRGVFAKEVEGGGSLIGRALVVNRAMKKGDLGDEDEAICGVVARSANLMQNLKKVCSCSGKTVWEERESKEI